MLTKQRKKCIRGNMSRLDFVSDDFKGNSKLTTHEANSLKEIITLMQDEWFVQVFFDFESNKWVCYCFKHIDKKFEYKKFTFKAQFIAQYMRGRGDMGESLFSNWETIKDCSKSWVNILNDYATGQKYIIRRP